MPPLARRFRGNRSGMAMVSGVRSHSAIKPKRTALRLFFLVGDPPEIRTPDTLLKRHLRGNRVKPGFLKKRRKPLKIQGLKVIS